MESYNQPGSEMKGHIEEEEEQQKQEKEQEQKEMSALIHKIFPDYFKIENTPAFLYFYIVLTLKAMQTMN